MQSREDSSSPLDVLKMLTSAHAADRESPAASRDPLAQAMELLDRHRRRHALPAYTLRPGDLVREKMGLRMMRYDDVLILWEMYDTESEDHNAAVKNYREHAAYNGAPINCFVAWIHTNSRAVAVMPHSTFLLEPVDTAFADQATKP